MKRILYFIVPLMLLASCTAYHKEVAKDCPPGKGIDKGVVCISTVPKYIENYADMLEKDTMQMLAHVGFIVEDDGVDWVYKPSENGLVIHSRYMTASVEQWKKPAVIFFGITISLILAILFFLLVDATWEKKRKVVVERVKGLQMEIEASKELQKAGISSGTRELDLIANQALTIDDLIREVASLKKTERSWNITKIQLKEAMGHTDDTSWDVLHPIALELLKKNPHES